MNESKVDYSGAVETTKKMHELCTNLTSEINNAKSAGSINASGLWVSPASKNFEERINALSADINNLLEKLDYAVIYMTKATENYKNLDEKVIQAVANAIKETK